MLLSNLQKLGEKDRKCYWEWFVNTYLGYQFLNSFPNIFSLDCNGYRKLTFCCTGSLYESLWTAGPLAEVSWNFGLCCSTVLMALWQTLRTSFWSHPVPISEVGHILRFSTKQWADEFLTKLQSFRLVKIKSICKWENEIDQNSRKQEKTLDFNILAFPTKFPKPYFCQGS